MVKLSFGALAFNPITGGFSPLNNNNKNVRGGDLILTITDVIGVSRAKRWGNEI